MSHPQGETYLDIVWREFKKNRPAYRMLWGVVGLFLIAIFAPALASRQPFWFTENGETLFPWIVALFNPETVVDFIFNMALLIFFPWVALALVANRIFKRRGAHGRRRVLAAVGLFLVLLPVAVAVFSVARPGNRYFDRDFKRDEALGRGSGTYALIPYGPTEQDLDIIFKPPLHRKQGESRRVRDDQIHLFGTDDSGRDVFVRILYGTRISMTIGFVAVSIYIGIGIIVGAIAGYFGGRIDMIISRIIEVVLLLPAFFLILAIVALIGPSIYIIMVVIGVTGWPTIARLIRGEFLRQRSNDYVTAARAFGASNARVMFRHILPNALAPAFVAAPFGIAGAIVTEAGLSVLGFGVRPPTPSWGAILNLALGNYYMWWLTLFAGLSIFFTVTVFNLVGNGLRDAMDPRLKGNQ